MEPSVPSLIASRDEREEGLAKKGCLTSFMFLPGQRYFSRLFFTHTTTDLNAILLRANVSFGLSPQEGYDLQVLHLAPSC